MQGKIALEEHFAIEATLADSQVFGAHVWQDLRPAPDRHPGHAAARNGQARDRDDDPVAQRAGGAGDPRCQARDCRGQRGQRRARRARAPSAPGASPPLPRCRCRTRKRPPTSSRAASSEFGFVGALVNGFSQAGTPDTVALLRRAAIPAVLARGGSARRAVLPAPAQSAAELDANSTKAIPGCSDRTGPSPRKPPCTRCG